MTDTLAATAASQDELTDLMMSWQRKLVARGKSPHTVKTYLVGVRLFHRFLRDQGMPRTRGGVTREPIEAWITHLLEDHEKSSVAARHQILVHFFKWLMAEDEISRSPMEKVERLAARPRRVVRPARIATESGDRPSRGSDCPT